jgi:hypothetical protein
MSISLREKELREGIRKAKRIKLNIGLVDFYIRVTKKDALRLVKADSIGDLFIAYFNYSEGSGNFYLVIS